MNRNILVAVAWPYASADIHVGNITGSYLPADIYARFHRLQGNRVLMVSGSDSHGTPITGSGRPGEQHTGGSLSEIPCQIPGSVSKNRPQL